MHRRVEALLAHMPEHELLLLQHQWYNPAALTYQCRLVIRRHLLQEFNYRSLFLLVPRLPVPVLLQKFLLLDQQVPREEDVPCFMKETCSKVLLDV